MSYFDFLATHSKVESVLGLLSFIIAAVLGFMAYQNAARLKGIGKIVGLANTQSKANLATALLEVMPSYQLPDLNQRQGFEIIKLQMAQKSAEFTAKMKLLRLGILLFTVVVLVITVTTYVKFDQYKTRINAVTHGDKSPVVIGSHAEINFVDTAKRDSTSK